MVRVNHQPRCGGLCTTDPIAQHSDAWELHKFSCRVPQAGSATPSTRAAQPTKAVAAVVNGNGDLCHLRVLVGGMLFLSKTPPEPGALESVFHELTLPPATDAILAQNGSCPQFAES